MRTEDLLRKIEAANTEALTPNRHAVQAGPFTLLLSPSSPLQWINNAVLADTTAEIIKADVQAMVEAFRANDRMPRMELFSGIHGTLIRTLQATGFEIESEMPLMVCTPEMFQPQRSSEARLAWLKPDGDLETAMRLVDAAFEHEEPITPARIEASRRSLEKGSIRTALAYLDDRAAAVASLVVAKDVAELAGVGTLPEFRRRGAASAVSTFALEDFFKPGYLAWLSAGDEIAKAVYERLGFQLIGTQVNISLPN